MNKFRIFSLLTSLIICLGVLTSCGALEKSDNSKTEIRKISEQSVSDSDESENINNSDSNSSSENSENDVASDITPAMWLVTSPEGNTMVCLGSMHALTEKDYPLPEEITDAFNNADVLAVECDITGKNNLVEQLALLRSATLRGDDEAANHMSEEAYEILSERLAEFNISIEALKKYKPWFLQNTYESLIQMNSGLNAELGIDFWLLEQAHNSGKEIYEVEDYDFQMNLLTNMSDETYDLMFRALEGETKKSQILALKNMYEVWRTGNFEKFESMAIDVDYGDMTDKDIKIYERYNEEMITDRNRTMADAVKKLLGEGKNVFFAVGAAHYAGDKGILNLLETDGYTCERIEYKQK